MEITREIKCFKYLVYAYIVFLSLSGGLQVFFGATFTWNHLSYSLIVGNNFWVPSTVLLCLGPCTYILCWLGWNATSKRNRSYLRTFTVLLVILLCIQFALGAWSLAMREKLPGAAKHPIDLSYSDFVSPKVKLDHTHVWHKIQYQLQCCGVYDLQDYFRHQIGVPWSCCSVPLEPGDSGCKNFYQRGCLSVLSDDIRDKLFQIAIILVCTAIIQSMGLFCIIQLTILLTHAKAEEQQKQSASPRVSERRRNKELLPLAQTNKLSDQAKY